MYLTSANIKIKMTNTQVANNSYDLEEENKTTREIDELVLFLKLNCCWSNILCLNLFREDFEKYSVVHRSHLITSSLWRRNYIEKASV